MTSILIGKLFLGARFPFAVNFSICPVRTKYSTPKEVERFLWIFRTLLALAALWSLDAWVVLLHCAELFSVPSTVSPLGLTRIGFQKNDAVAAQS